MRILWYVNAMPGFFRSPDGRGDYYVTGGWIDGMLEALSQREDIDLTVCFPRIGEGGLLRGRRGRADWISFPVRGVYSVPYEPQAEGWLDGVMDLASPELIHIFGTETPHALALVRRAEARGLGGRVLVHIQGLSCICGEEYAAGLPPRVFSRGTPRDRLRRDSLVDQREHFLRQGEYEKELLRRVRYAGVRTRFDREAVLEINPSLRCLHCGESLRGVFYQTRWQREGARPHGIFVSQGGYPLKGLHFLLEALPQVCRAYPDTLLTVAGGDPTRGGEGLRGILSRGGYGAYIAGLIRRLGLSGHVRFTGTLTPEEMLTRYLEAELFVCSSYVENSPNSLGEAMLLGLPAVAAATGGIPSMLTQGEEGILVPFGDVQALSRGITEVFSQPEAADARAEKARLRALNNHDRRKNMEELMEQYQQIAKNERLLYERRIWGEYRVVDESCYPDGTRTLVKHITLDPGKGISYQKHAHRDEVWTIAFGTGEFVLDGQRRSVRPGDVLTVAKGHLHTIRADEGCPLHLIEVQSGDLLEERDIERFPYQW